MMPVALESQAPVPPPAYHRRQARLGAALHIDALTLITSLHLLALCRLAVRLSHHRCPPPLPAGPGGSPRIYSEESLLLIALLRTLWRLSYEDMRDWLRDWPALALACGLPLGKDGRDSLEPQTAEELFLSASHLDQRGVRQTQLHRTLLWPCLPLLSFATSPVVWLVGHCSAGCLDVYGHHHCRPGCSAGRPP